MFFSIVAAAAACHVIYFKLTALKTELCARFDFNNQLFCISQLETMSIVLCFVFMHHHHHCRHILTMNTISATFENELRLLNEISTKLLHFSQVSAGTNWAFSSLALGQRQGSCRSSWKKIKKKTEIIHYYLLFVNWCSLVSSSASIFFDGIKFPLFLSHCISLKMSFYGTFPNQFIFPLFLIASFIFLLQFNRI